MDGVLRMSDLIAELGTLVGRFREEAKKAGPGVYYMGHETAWETAAAELEKLLLQHIRETEVEDSLVHVKWQCEGCKSKLTGNPRHCPWCGYTVYRPILPEKVS